MNSSILLSADASAAAGGSMWISLDMIVVLVGVMYFVMISPQNKRRKKEEKMRQDLQIGDEVTTIGGIMGKIVSIKEETDSLVIETGIDRSKIRVKRWSVASCDTVHDTPES